MAKWVQRAIVTGVKYTVLDSNYKKLGELNTDEVLRSKVSEKKALKDAGLPEDSILVTPEKITKLTFQSEETWNENCITEEEKNKIEESEKGE